MYTNTSSKDLSKMSKKTALMLDKYDLLMAKKSDKKLSGFGYLAEGNLLCPCISKNSKPYIRIFNDVEKRCRKINEKTDEFQGYKKSKCSS